MPFSDGGSRPPEAVGLSEILPVVDQVVIPLTASRPPEAPLVGGPWRSTMCSWVDDASIRGRRGPRTLESGSVHRAPGQARLRHVCSYPDALEVAAHDHVVVIKGPILRREHELVLVAASEVRGVGSIRDRLVVHLEADDVPELQGPARGGPRRMRGWTVHVPESRSRCWGSGCSGARPARRGGTDLGRIQVEGLPRCV